MVPRMQMQRLGRWLGAPLAKPVWFLASLGPAIWLTFAVFADRLGANPAEALIRSSGDWSLRALCMVLAITPVRTELGLPALARFRRMAGLYVYFYATLHFLAYSGLDMGLEPADIGADIAKRPFILVGFLGWLLLSALALTSFDRAIRWIGGLNWRRLHRAVYAVALLAILHFFWMRAAKHNFFEVAIYASLLGALLLWRLRGRFNKLLGRRTG